MATFMDIRNSQLNNSRFKQLYSFPKANRFISQDYISTAPYYDNKITSLNPRSTSLGYGNKYSLQNKEQIPPPNKYNKEGIFDSNLNKGKGNKFSLSNKKGLIDQDEAKGKPGPGKYIIKKDQHDFKNVSFSMRKRISDQQQRLQNALGPGQYTTIGELSGEGKYYVTKYRNSGCSKIGNSKRFTSLQSVSPGPGKYDDKATNFNRSGKYFFSIFRTSQSNSFSVSKRKSIANQSISPGPGSYQKFSQFPSIHRHR